MNSENRFGLPEEVLKKMSAVFAQYKEVERVILYGSRAKGNYRLGSDIDLCVVGKKISLSQLLKIGSQLDDLDLPWKIDLTLKHSLDNPSLIQHIEDQGILFYCH